MKTILVTKESRAGETRVALLPVEVRTLVASGCKVLVEESAGTQAGFSDEDYVVAGACIRPLAPNTLQDFQKHFADVDIIVRVKRPAREREILENQAFPPGLIMIGALDPLEHGSGHVDEYRAANISAFSIDQLASLTPNHPLNLLAGMSHIAGILAIQDAISLFTGVASRVVIVGFGAAGRSAFAEARSHKLAVTVLSVHPSDISEVQTLGATGILLDLRANLETQQEIVALAVRDAHIVITSARQPGKRAPLLIPAVTLNLMVRDAVIVDLALSEGGNVEGSRHDETLIVGNNVKVTNTSGYPKKLPRQASEIWSRASACFVNHLLANEMLLLMSSQITTATLALNAGFKPG
jgi:NAD(P) transhydrogenase subunit alpha